jgi:hypothetical protein
VPVPSGHLAIRPDFIPNDDRPGFIFWPVELRNVFVHMCFFRADSYDVAAPWFADVAFVENFRAVWCRAAAKSAE